MDYDCHSYYNYVDIKLLINRLPDSFTGVHQHAILIPSEIYAVASLSNAR